MMMQVFDPSTQQSSQLSPPTEYRYSFALLTYRIKIYLIGGTIRDEDGSKMKTYNPETYTWEYLPDLPYAYDSINAIVINDRVIVYDDNDSKNMKKRMLETYVVYLWLT